MSENQPATGQPLKQVAGVRTHALLDTTRFLSHCRLASRLAGLLSVSVGLMVLLGGWALDISILRVIVPGYSAMRPNTALGLALCGSALLLDGAGLALGWKRLAVLACSGIAFLIGAVTLIEYLLGRTLGIDALMFPGSLTLIAPDRMAVTTAVALVLLGGSLLLSRHRRSFAVGQYLVITAGVLCLFNVIGYFYGMTSFYGLAFKTGSTAMAIHTALTFLVLCAGALIAHPEWGVMSTVSSPAPGGVMARRLLPAALLIPPAVGWLRWRGQVMGLYDTAFGLTIVTAVTVVIFGFLIWRIGQTLNDLDFERAQAEESMRQLADSMPQIVWTATAAGESDYFNRRCYDYTGMRFEQIRDGGWFATIHPDDVEGVKESRARAFALREPYTLEYRFRRASDGMYRWHLAQGIPVFNPQGELVRWIGTCTDIHSIKLTKESLRKSESYFHELADSMPQIVWTATPDGNLDYYNQRWFDYTGMTFEQTKNWGWKPVLHPDDLQNCIDRWTHTVKTCAPYEIEYRFKRGSDSVYRWYLGRARPIRDANGAVVRWFGTCTDIEEYKQAEAEIRLLNEGLEQRVRERTAELDRTNEQREIANQELKASSLRLEQSNRELQDFAAVASHDLQEPLRKVQTFGDRLKTLCGPAMDAQGRDYLDRMLNASRRMQSLIQDLLLFSRVTSQAHPFSPVNLAQVAEEVLSDLEVRIAETNARVEIGDLPTIDADAVQMRQLLQNLIGNALKFHQKGKPPVVRVFGEKPDFKRTGDVMFVLTVEDEGIGFDEKYLDRIFTVFQRLHGRAEYEGTGVGLAICRKIAQRHGGDITAKSVLGEGTSFLVTLPFRRGSQSQHRASDAKLIRVPGDRRSAPSEKPGLSIVGKRS